MRRAFAQAAGVMSLICEVVMAGSRVNKYRQQAAEALQHPALKPLLDQAAD